MKYIYYILLFCSIQNIGYSIVMDSSLNKIKDLSNLEDQLIIIVDDGWKIHPANPSQSLDYAKYCVKQDGFENLDPYLINNIYRLMAFSYGDLNKWAETLDCHLNRIRFLEKTDSISKPLVAAYFEATAVLEGQGQKEEAAKYYSKTLDLSKQIGFDNAIALIYTNLSSERLKNNLFEESLNYIDSAIQIHQRNPTINSPIFRAVLLFKIAFSN